MTNRDKLVEIMLRYPRALCDHCGDDNWLEANAQQFADRLIANGVTVQQWRDAKTDPPKQDEDVLLCFSNGTMVVGGLLEDGGWYSNTDAEWYTDCETVPEKWMPLSKVPKEEPK